MEYSKVISLSLSLLQAGASRRAALRSTCPPITAGQDGGCVRNSPERECGGAKISVLDVRAEVRKARRRIKRGVRLWRNGRNWRRTQRRGSLDLASLPYWGCGGPR